MNILVDIGHPAHVHLMKNLIKELTKKKTPCCYHNQIRPYYRKIIKS